MTLEGAASSKSLANEEGVHNWKYSSKLRLRSEPTKETQTTSAFAILTPEENIHEGVANIFKLYLMINLDVIYILQLFFWNPSTGINQPTSSTDLHH